MRKLLRGERLASAGVILGLVAVMLLLACSVGLSLYYRHDALRSDRQLQKTTTTLVTLKQTIVGRCEQRQTYDQSNHDAIQANAEFYASLIAIAAEQPIPPGTDPKLVALFERQKAAIRLAHQAMARAADGGVIGTCSAYR